MTESSWFLADEAATQQCGRALAASLPPVVDSALVVTLEGNLGAGKTTFCRGVLNGLGHVGTVKSPTYTLVEPYELPAGAVYHFDLYRLKDPQELEFFGVRDYFDHGRLCLVEWPDKGAGFLPAPDLILQLVPEQGGRRLTALTMTAAGESLLKTFSAQAFTATAK